MLACDRLGASGLRSVVTLGIEYFVGFVQRGLPDESAAIRGTGFNPGLVESGEVGLAKSCRHRC